MRAERLLKPGTWGPQLGHRCRTGVARNCRKRRVQPIRNAWPGSCLRVGPCSPCFLLSCPPKHLTVDRLHPVGSMKCPALWPMRPLESSVRFGPLGMAATKRPKELLTKQRSIRGGEGMGVWPPMQARCGRRQISWIRLNKPLRQETTMRPRTWRIKPQISFETSRTNCCWATTWHRRPLIKRARLGRKPIA